MANNRSKTSPFSKILWVSCLCVIATQVVLLGTFLTRSSKESFFGSANSVQHQLQNYANGRLSSQMTAIDPVAQGRHEIVDFERQDGVVVVVKVHGGNHSMRELQQSLCLFKMAYNGRMNYDHLVFSTEPMPPEFRAFLRILVAPARIQFVIDSPPLHEAIAMMSEQRRTKFLKRCNTTDPTTLTWQTKCKEHLPRVGDKALSYNWMAEFRTKYLWTHWALQPYKYALWFDADAMCTKVWDRDPVAEMIRNDLVILFDNFPSGRIYDDGATIPDRIQRAFGTSICNIELKDGQLKASSTPPLGSQCLENGLETIHGFFHITNIDFFRSDAYQKWANILIGDDAYSRQLNDEVAVTVAASLLAPDRSWDMQSHGLSLKVMHNGQLDGNEPTAYSADRKKKIVDGKKLPWYSFLPWWKYHAEKEFPEAWDICQTLVTANG